MLALFLFLSLGLLVVSEEIIITGVRLTSTRLASPQISQASASVSLAPLGTGSDGIATFGAVVSIESGGSPFPLPARTFHATYLAGPTQLVFSAVGDGIEVGPSHTSTFATAQTEVEACSWGEERVQGTCVLEINGSPMLTFTGTVGPVFTLTVDNAATSPSAGSTWLLSLLLAAGVALGIFRVFY